MQKHGKASVSVYMESFCLGALLGTALGFVTALPESLRGEIAVDAFLGPMLLHTLSPFFLAFLLSKTLGDRLSRGLTLLCRGFNVSLVLSLLLRSGRQAEALAYIVSLALLLPAFFLWVEPPPERRYRKSKLLRFLLIVVLWYVGTFLRCYLLSLPG